MRRFDPRRKGKLAFVDDVGMRCSGRTDEVWSVACSKPIQRSTGVQSVSFMLLQQSSVYTSFGVAKPKANLDERVGFQEGGVCLDARGSLWINGIEQHGGQQLRGFRSGDPLRLEVDTEREPLVVVFIVGNEEVCRAEISEWSFFAVGGVGEQHKYKIDTEAEAISAAKAENEALRAEILGLQSTLKAQSTALKALSAGSERGKMAALQQRNEALQAEVTALTQELMALATARLGTTPSRKPSSPFAARQACHSVKPSAMTD